MEKRDTFNEESVEAWNAYFIDGTDVLKNKLNITNNEDLDREERKIVDKKLSELHDNPIEGDFDIKHMCAIHKYLFGDIYDWAGEFRTVYMTRDTKHPYFVKARDIEEYLEDDLKLINEKYRGIYSYDYYIDFLTDFYVSLLNIHPFREGNGRAIREFLREFTVKKMEMTGLEPCDLDWSKADHAAIEEAMPMARAYKYPIRKEIAKIFVPIEKEEHYGL